MYVCYKMNIFYSFTHGILFLYFVSTFDSVVTTINRKYIFIKRKKMLTIYKTSISR